MAYEIPITTQYFPLSTSNLTGARNGSGTADVTVNGQATVYGQMGAYIKNDNNYSDASVIKNLKIDYTVSISDGQLNGSYAEKGWIKARTMVGGSSMFTLNGSTITNFNSYTSIGAYADWTKGVSLHTDDQNASSGSSPSATPIQGLLIGADFCMYSDRTFSSNKNRFRITNVRASYTLVVKNRINWVSASGDLSSYNNIYDKDSLPTSIPSDADQLTYASNTHQRFNGWKSSADNQVYSRTEIPACTGYDVTYTADFEPEYTLNLTVVDSANNTLSPPSGMSSGGKKYLNDSINVSAPLGDYVYSDTATYIFQSWSLHKANGDLIDTSSSRNWDIGVLDSAKASLWFTGGADSITAKAHYQRVYDISLNIGDPSDGDPAGVGKNGIVSISVVSDGTTQTYTKDQVLTGGIVARVDNPAVQIHTTFTATNEYDIFSTAFYGVPSGSTEYTKSWQGAAYVVSGTITTSNWYFNIRAWKRYFDLNISGDTDGVLKVYSVSSNGTRSLISPTHIPRTTKVEIEADGELMLQKTHDTAVTSITPNTNTSVANGKGIITSLLQNHTITVARTQVNCTMTKIVDSVESTETVVRSNPYRYIIAAESGWTISSATLTMRGMQIQSWQNATAIDYTIQSVTGDCVLTVNRVQNPQAYVTIQTPTSSYGTVNVVGATSVLKTEFNGFTVSSVTALPAYEVVAATYRWMVGDATVGTGTINPTTGTTIQYPSATIPGDQDVVLVVDVQYRKNIVYYSHKPNDPKRPQSLWYTPVGQAPQRVVAVYAQTKDHTSPILLYGEVT